MEKKIYYPAMFFSDIVVYYGGTSIYIEQLFKENIENMKIEKLLELKEAVENLQITSHKMTETLEKKGAGLLTDLKKVKAETNDRNKIKILINLIKKVKASEKIHPDILENLSSVIQEISEEEPEKRNGYSDTSIERFKNTQYNALKERNYNDIIDFLIEPQAQGDYATFTANMLSCINEEKYNNLPIDKRNQIRNYLCDKKFKGVYILRIFRILEKCSIGFQEDDKNKIKKILNSKLNDEIELMKKIENTLKTIWGETEAEGVGISQREKDEIILNVSKALLKDYNFYYTNGTIDVDISKGFQALIFYRLYNKIFYYKNTKSIRKERNNSDLQKALAFFSFSILQRAIEHTDILLHPAAQIGVPAYIGEHVMVGKQCRLASECILDENVCLYPFNNYNNEFNKKEIYLDIGHGSIFCKNVKVMGCIYIGKRCIINKSILIGRHIDDNLYISNEKIVKAESREYNNIKKQIMGGLYE